MKNKIIFQIVFAGLFVLAFTRPAYAYLDPGTGSMILQILLGGIAGALTFGKFYWKTLKEKFTRKKSSPVEGLTSNPPNDLSND